MEIQSHRVLIVEDEIFIAGELEFILRDVGIQVIGPALSVAEALRFIEDGEVTAAILDFQLGKQDSTPVALRLADLGIPFVFHTGMSDIAAVTDTWLNVPVLRKPAQPDTVIAAITSLVRIDRPA